MKKYFLQLTTATALATAAHAAVTTNFVVDAASTNPTRENFGTSLTLVYSVDASGNVSLDASPGSTAPLASVTTVNGWDGPVGSVTDSALFGQSFTLTVSGLRRENDGTTFSGVNLYGDGLYNTADGGIGVEGENASLIDGGGLADDNIERLQFTLSSSIPGLELTLDQITVGGNAGSDVELGHGGTTSLLSNIGSGDEDVSGNNIVIRDGESFYLGATIPVTGDNTVGGPFNLDAFRFTASAIPEPSSSILIGLAGLSLLARRRR